MPTTPAPGAAQRTVAFGASWSRSTRLLTVVFLGSCIAIMGVSYSGPPLSWLFVATTIAVAATIAGAYCFAPTGYQLDDDSVLIRRRVGPKVVRLTAIRGARLMEPEELSGSIPRWPAVGGIFGFFGTFETPALGKHRWYAARDEDLVLLQTTSGPLVLSPDEPDTFVREVNQRLRSAPRI